MVTPTTEEIRKRARELFLSRHVKAEGETPTTPEDSELKEGGQWGAAQRDLMGTRRGSEAYAQQEKYMHDMGSEMGLSVVPQEDRRRERWQVAAAKASLRHTQEIHEHPHRTLMSISRAGKNWRERGKAFNKKMPKVIKNRSSGTWSGLFSVDVPKFLQKPSYVKKQYTRLGKEPSAHPLLPFAAWPSPTKQGLTEAGYKEPMGFWGGLWKGPESSLDVFFRGTSEQQLQRKQRHKLAQESFQSGILSGIRKRGISMGFSQGYRLAYPPRMRESLDLGVFAVPSIWDSAFGLYAPPQPRRVRSKRRKPRYVELRLPY